MTKGYKETTTTKNPVQTKFKYLTFADTLIGLQL